MQLVQASSLAVRVTILAAVVVVLRLLPLVAVAAV
jgi:hypothetical protein